MEAGSAVQANGSDARSRIYGAFPLCIDPWLVF